MQKKDKTDLAYMRLFNQNPSKIFELNREENISVNLYKILMGALTEK